MKSIASDIRCFKSPYNIQMLCVVPEIEMLTYSRIVTRQMGRHRGLLCFTEWGSNSKIDGRFGSDA